MMDFRKYSRLFTCFFVLIVCSFILQPNIKTIHGSNFFLIPTLSPARRHKILQESQFFDKVMRSWSDSIQQKILCTHSRKDAESSEYQYVVVKLKPGLCNSMVSLTSSLALALLSNRRLILKSENFVSDKSKNDYQASIGDVFEPPVHFGSCWPTLQSVTEMESQENTVQVTFLRGARIRTLVRGKTITEKIDLLCGSWIQRLSAYKFWEIDSYQAFFLAMYINPLMRSSIHEIGAPSFGAMARSIFRPKQHIQNEVLKHHAMYLQKSPSIGFQVRVAYLRPVDSTIVLDFLRCTDEDPGSVFVSTDSKLIRQKFKEYFYDLETISFNSTIDRSALNGIEGAVRDMWTLAGTDEIIGSSVSTFGQCASGLLGAKRRIILSQRRARLVSLRPFECVSGNTGVCMRQEVWKKMMGTCKYVSSNRFKHAVNDQMACTYRSDEPLASREVSCKSCKIENENIDSLA